MLFNASNIDLASRLIIDRAIALTRRIVGIVQQTLAEIADQLCLLVLQFGIGRHFLPPCILDAARKREGQHNNTQSPHAPIIGHEGALWQAQ